ncbi:hydrogenase maturation nickel metallochaperone HypA [Legionella jordanis]|uniref:Hydrogenase maturation factor HypA n=1 Tax=Legionella jordanis TaxID=456 RepID=A0A0W0VGH0_9GAMM|nr:hydrogenase maturation nickel metallochaperone HypA [Legionella jordanis]KTD19224.1 hydrogenase nickel incorporation protein HypA [Legionella jordanis]RMW99840.1 hydrogenase maturation nickel metallochaperone HypA [Legionella jordanis]RMX15134.1 hydrogenase maturation nickel metallochaperone HypA [Legionella jordanis]VEH12890.1 hydrogenase nickel incorporation protein HypA [Legionella jordanis]HAT8714856.1 hydrogenase maturation nickel metallochaperone HypA [Legionella jordanis]
MHELSLCQRILDVVNEYLNGVSCQRVKIIHLEVGQLKAINPMALTFAFEVLTKGSKLENACLDIYEIEGLAICDNCHKTVKLKHYGEPCNYCHQYHLTLLQGDELRLKSMEVE